MSYLSVTTPGLPAVLPCPSRCPWKSDLRPRHPPYQCALSPFSKLQPECREDPRNLPPPMRGYSTSLLVSYCSLLRSLVAKPRANGTATTCRAHAPVMLGALLPRAGAAFNETCARHSRCAVRTCAACDAVTVRDQRQEPCAAAAAAANARYEYSSNYRQVF